MSEFTACNGIPVIPDGHGGFQFVSGIAQMGTITGITAGQVEALRQFFVKENDDRLGRWRWPENPAWLVKHVGGHEVVVIHEEDFWVNVSRQGQFNRFHFRDARNHGARLSDRAAAYKRAAWAFFEAHPELCPKPWHDAKPGETWRLTVNDRQPDDIELTFNVIGVEGVMRSRFARPQISGEQMEYAIDSPAIVAGHCIWPEVRS